MRRLRFIFPKEGIDHFSICPCIRSEPMPRSVAKIGDIFPKLIMPLAVCDGPAFCFESKALLEIM